MRATDEQIKAVAQRMLAIFDNKPERWTKGADGRRPDGTAAKIASYRNIRDGAVCFCLKGSAFVAAAELYRTDMTVVDATIARETLQRFRTVTGRDPVLLNDHPETTFEMVLAPLRQIAGATA